MVRRPLSRALGGRGAKEGQAGGAGPTRPWTAPVRPTRVRRHAGVDTAKALAFPYALHEAQRQRKVREKSDPRRGR